MKLPSLSLAMIIKNERKNLPRLFESIAGCMDEIHMTDTGSTDGSVEWLQSEAEKIAGCPVHIHHFEWVNDFSKARNYSLSHVTSDFVLWLDADDVISNKENFIHWKHHAMQFVDLWLATYHYALDQAGKPIVSFMRERVFRNSLKPQFKYPIHEGVLGEPHWSRNYITTWTVNHMRDIEDIKQDKSRNLSILESIEPKDARLTFYYGKELYEGSRPYEAIAVLDKASKMQGIEHHDKILSHQYAAYSAMAASDQIKDELRDEKIRLLDQAMGFAHGGIRLDPHRAEFFTTIGDCLIKKGMLREAIPYFAAAKSCINPRSSGSPYEGAIYSFVNCYGELPSLQLSKIYFHLGNLDQAEIEAKDCFERYGNAEAQAVLNEAKRIRTLTTIENNQAQTDDIVFTCPPYNAMEFDEEIYQTKGCGGSETALVEMAKHLKVLTGKPVKVFNMREEDKVCESGVEYISNKKLNHYLSDHKPLVNIAWRHNIKITEAPTYLWCHDLQVQTVETAHNFDRLLCLTPFHKDYIKGLQGVPEEKIWVTRNGIAPEKFAFERPAKNPNKVVYMSSADRGLDSCMLIMDKVVEEFPACELHLYYGYENLYKYGPHMSALADKIKGMIEARPYVKYHGFTEQKKMYREVADAAIWLHPASFIETSCITAMEMLALGVFPITRSLGGLKDTLKEAESLNQAVLLEHESGGDIKLFTENDVQTYYQEVCKALLNKSWERVSVDVEKLSWANVAHEWIETMRLNVTKA